VEDLQFAVGGMGAGGAGHRNDCGLRNSDCGIEAALILTN
jgi:hypothetical protein